MRLLKSSLLLGTPILLSIAAYTSYAQTPQSLAVTKTENTLPHKILHNLSLNEADHDLLLSLAERSFLGGTDKLIEALERQWTEAYVPPALEIFNFVPDSKIRRALVDKLVETTGQDFGTDVNAWYKWLWNEPALVISGYDNFKSKFYNKIDPTFGRYFKDRATSAQIRLDEIRWGGVRQDGIPPLRQPKMIEAKDAKYLGDDNIVFGIEVNGDVRAYPKRILAWHEMFVDEVGGTNFAGVYCTLCGTVILYETEEQDVAHDLGTSGFLYRSNKLMYDKATQSLWNTIKGTPVLGPLVGKNIELNHQSVVTTTWGKWKSLHPDTTVLSIDTGYRRDYGEGVAYHQYFSTDNLMFNTPFSDQRLKNKQEVLALRFKEHPFEQVAISTDYLKSRPVYHGKIGNQNYVVLTDETGANRVYDPEDVTFFGFTGSRSARDINNQIWKVTENTLISGSGRELKRLPYHRAFWFGWHASYPNSKLIK